MIPSIEVLETRIAPAGVSVSYIDSDGDKVKITASQGPLDITDLILSNGTSGDLIQLNLNNAGFADANITFTVKKVAQGNGRANVGTINATGVDIGVLTVRGDVSRVLAGDNDSSTSALIKLQVRSLGVEKLGGITTTSVIGSIDTLSVTRDIQGARVYAHGPTIGIPDTNAQIGVIRIGGSLFGEGTSDSGSIEAEGHIGTIRILGNLVGGSGNFSGRIEAGTDITSLRVAKSIVGGAGPFSGMINTETGLGKASIGRDMVGGAGQGSGSLRINASIGDVFIGRDLLGGTGTESGLVWARDGDLGKVTIGRHVHGGDTIGATNIEKTGTIFAHDSIARVIIRGSLISGTDMGGGTLKTSGAIVAGKHLGPVTVGGGIVGNTTMRVLISAVAQETEPLTGTDFAIDRLTVGRGVTYADVKAGFNTNGVADNADASIGRVRIGGGWSFSNLVAGVQDTGTPGFGLGDTVQPVDNNLLTAARIAGISIGGRVTGEGGGIFGFVSQHIDFLIIAGKKVSQNPGPSNDPSKLVGGTTNVYLQEVA
jgi:hypothetical protein